MVNSGSHPVGEINTRCRRLCGVSAFSVAVFLVSLGSISGVGCAKASAEYSGVAVLAGRGHRGLSAEQLVARTARSVAVVETDVGRGLAFVIDPAGYLITNRHVIEDADHIESVTFPGMDPPKRFAGVQIVYTDPQRDLALLYVHTPTPLPRLPMAAKKRMPVSRYLGRDDRVFVLQREETETGVMFRAHNTAVTQTAAHNPVAGPGPFVGVGYDIQRGQSGGPILDRFGRVVGIVTWTYRDRPGGFGIPISHAMDMLARRPALKTDLEHRDRVEARSREFLTALGRGDVRDARRMTSPSHARQLREHAVEKILLHLGENGTVVIQGFIGAVEGLVTQAPSEADFAELRGIVGRTATQEFRDALSLPPSVAESDLVSFFYEFGQAYLLARGPGGKDPSQSLNAAMARLKTVDAARTFAIAEALQTLAGARIEIRRVSVVPGAYSPTAVVELETTSSVVATLGHKTQLTLHMRLEWGDWYIGSVGRTPLTQTSKPETPVITAHAVLNE